MNCYRVFVVLGFMTVLYAAPLRAAELVMFESDICEYCEMWHDELGAVYAKTDEGRRAPLRRVDIDANRPKDLSGLRGIRYTPTFVLVDEGREIGRILGYPGEEFFWAQLANLIKRLENKGKRVEIQRLNN